MGLGIGNMVWWGDGLAVAAVVQSSSGQFFRPEVSATAVERTEVSVTTAARQDVSSAVTDRGEQSETVYERLDNDSAKWLRPE